MNKASVQYINLKNQGSLGNDDPFDLPWSVTGVTSLSHSRNLYFYADEIVANHATFDGESYNISFSDIPEDEQNELARLYMEFTDRDTCECVYGNDLSINSDYTCAILNLLKENCQQNRDALSTIIRKNILTYYQSSLQKLLDNACDDYLNNINNEAGYFSYQNQDSGDIEWRKI